MTLQQLSESWDDDVIEIVGQELNGYQLEALITTDVPLLVENCTVYVSEQVNSWTDRRNPMLITGCHFVWVTDGWRT